MGVKAWQGRSGWRQAWARAVAPDGPAARLPTADLTASESAEVYSSPILHHVLLPGLQPGTTYFYTVGESRHSPAQPGRASAHDRGGGGGTVPAVHAPRRQARLTGRPAPQAMTRTGGARSSTSRRRRAPGRCASASPVTWARPPTAQPQWPSWQPATLMWCCCWATFPTQTTITRATVSGASCVCCRCRCPRRTLPSRRDGGHRIQRAICCPRQLLLCVAWACRIDLPAALPPLGACRLQAAGRRSWATNTSQTSLAGTRGRAWRSRCWRTSRWSAAAATTRSRCC